MEMANCLTTHRERPRKRPFLLLHRHVNHTLPTRLRSWNCLKHSLNQIHFAMHAIDNFIRGEVFVEPSHPVLSNSFPLAARGSS